MGWPVVTVTSGGIPVTDNTAQGWGTPVDEATNGFGTAVTYVAAGGLPVLGGARGSSGPTAPVLALLGVAGSAVSFSIDVDDTVVAGDTVTLQTQITAGDWSSLITNTTHTITSGEDAANEIDLTPAGFANGNYDARAKAHHMSDSGWSNTVSFTIAVSAVGLAMDMSDFRNTYILLN